MPNVPDYAKRLSSTNLEHLIDNILIAGASEDTPELLKLKSIRDTQIANSSTTGYAGLGGSDVASVFDYKDHTMESSSVDTPNGLNLSIDIDKARQLGLDVNKLQQELPVTLERIFGEAPESQNTRYSFQPSASDEPRAKSNSIVSKVSEFFAPSSAPDASAVSVQQFVYKDVQTIYDGLQSPGLEQVLPVTNQINNYLTITERSADNRSNEWARIANWQADLQGDYFPAQNIAQHNESLEMPSRWDLHYDKSGQQQFLDSAAKYLDQEHGIKRLKYLDAGSSSVVFETVPDSQGRMQLVSLSLPDGVEDIPHPAILPDRHVHDLNTPDGQMKVRISAKFNQADTTLDDVARLEGVFKDAGLDPFDVRPAGDATRNIATTITEDGVRHAFVIDRGAVRWPTKDGAEGRAQPLSDNEKAALVKQWDADATLDPYRNALTEINTHNTMQETISSSVRGELENLPESSRLRQAYQDEGMYPKEIAAASEDAMVRAEKDGSEGNNFTKYFRENIDAFDPSIAPSDASALSQGPNDVTNDRQYQEGRTKGLESKNQIAHHAGQDLLQINKAHNVGLEVNSYSMDKPMGGQRHLLSVKWNNPAINLPENFSSKIGMGDSLAQFLQSHGIETRQTKYGVNNGFLNGPTSDDTPAHWHYIEMDIKDTAQFERADALVKNLLETGDTGLTAEQVKLAEEAGYPKQLQDVKDAAQKVQEMQDEYRRIQTTEQGHEGQVAAKLETASDNKTPALNERSIRDNVPEWLAEVAESGQKLSPVRIEEAQRMVRDLQTLKFQTNQNDPHHPFAQKTAKDIQSVVVKHMLTGDDNQAYMLGLEPDDLKKVAGEAKAATNERVSADFKELAQGMQDSATRQVESFRNHLAENIPEQHPDMPKAQVDTLAEELTNTYHRDHGQALFSEDGQMRPMELPSKQGLSPENRAIYDSMFRDFGFGPDSDRMRKHRFNQVAEAEIRAANPSMSDEQVRSVTNKQGIIYQQMLSDGEVTHNAIGSADLRDFKQLNETFEATEAKRGAFREMIDQQLRAQPDLSPSDIKSTRNQMLRAFDNHHKPGGPDIHDPQNATSEHPNVTERYKAFMAGLEAEALNSPKALEARRAMEQEVQKIVVQAKEYQMAIDSTDDLLKNLQEELTKKHAPEVSTAEIAQPVMEADQQDSAILKRQGKTLERRHQQAERLEDTAPNSKRLEAMQAQLMSEEAELQSSPKLSSDVDTPATQARPAQSAPETPDAPNRTQNPTVNPAHMDLHIRNTRGSAALNVQQAAQGIMGAVNILSSDQPLTSEEKVMLGINSAHAAMGTSGAVVDGLTYYKPTSTMGLKFGGAASVAGVGISSYDLYKNINHAVTTDQPLTWKKEGRDIMMSGTNFTVSSVGAVGSGMALFGGEAAATMGGRLMVGSAAAGGVLAVGMGAKVLMEGYSDNMIERGKIYEELHSETADDINIAQTNVQYVDIPGLKPKPEEYLKLNGFMRAVDSQDLVYSNGEPLKIRDLLDNPKDLARVTSSVAINERKHADAIREAEFDGFITRETIGSTPLGTYIFNPLGKVFGRDVKEEIQQSREDMVEATTIAKLGSVAGSEIAGELSDGSRNYTERYQDYERIIKPLEVEYPDQVQELEKLRQVRIGINDPGNISVRAENLGADSSDTNGLYAALNNARKEDGIRRKEAGELSKTKDMHAIQEFLGATNEQWNEVGSSGKSLEDIVGERAESGQLLGLLNNHIKNTSATKQVAAQKLAEVTFADEMKKVDAMSPEQRAAHFAKNQEFIEKAGLSERTDLSLVGLSTSELEYMQKKITLAPETLAEQARQEVATNQKIVDTLTEENTNAATYLKQAEKGYAIISDQPLQDIPFNNKGPDGKPLIGIDLKPIETLQDYKEDLMGRIEQQQGNISALKEQLGDSDDSRLSAQINNQEASLSALRIQYEGVQLQNAQYKIQQFESARAEFIKANNLEVSATKADDKGISMPSSEADNGNVDTTLLDELLSTQANQEAQDRLAKIMKKEKNNPNFATILDKLSNTLVVSNSQQIDSAPHISLGPPSSETRSV